MADFYDLKAGDKVGVLGSAWSSPIIKVVTRITPTRIVIGNDQYHKKNGHWVRNHYHKKNGHLVGNHLRQLLPLAETEKRIAKFQKERNDENRERIIHYVKSLYRITDAEIPATLRRIANEIEGSKS